jgi:hypothetical protein
MHRYIETFPGDGFQAQHRSPGVEAVYNGPPITPAWCGPRSIDLRHP